MKMLFLYPNLYENVGIPIGLAYFIPITKAAGREVSLLETTFYRFDYSANEILIEEEILTLRPQRTLSPDAGRGADAERKGGGGIGFGILDSLFLIEIEMLRSRIRGTRSRAKVGSSGRGGISEAA